MTELPSDWHLLPIAATGDKHAGSVLGKGWQLSSSSNPKKIKEWQEAGHNLALHLGPVSGVIDVEADGEEAERVANEMLGHIDCPSWKSQRGTHRIFSWDDRFVEPGKTVIKYQGIEFRVGGTNAAGEPMGCISVLPPADGRLWQRLPSESEPPKLPDFIWNVVKDTARKPVVPIATGPMNMDDAARRASQYLAQMDVCECGTASCHDRTFRAACKMVGGFGLDEETAFRLLASEYAPRGTHQWSERELRHKVQSAAKEPGERGALLAAKSTKTGRPPVVDLSAMVGNCEALDDESESDEEFFQSMIPPGGLIRDIFEYYWDTSFKRTYSIGLATSISICQTIFGRRVQSHTGIRTNDYNVVIASTGTGKDACKKTAASVLRSGAAKAKLSDFNAFLLPSRIKSSTGLVKQMAEKYEAIWVCDEFGKVLMSILDPKSKTGPLVEVASDLLEFYGDSNGIFLGAAYATGEQYQIEQPHLCLLGISTNNFFDSVNLSHVEDGLIGRVAFWPVQERPKRSRGFEKAPVPETLADRVGAWMAYTPGLGGVYPNPVEVPMDDVARQRWTEHLDNIETRMEDEPEIRAAVWSRVATRTMKLALTARVARHMGSPENLEMPSAEPIGVEDVNWAVRLANRLARIACDLIGENVVNTKADRAKQLVLDVVRQHPEGVSQSWFRKKRSFTAGDIRSAAKELELLGAIKITKDYTKGRPKTLYFPG